MKVECSLVEAAYAQIDYKEQFPSSSYDVCEHASHFIEFCDFTDVVERITNWRRVELSHASTPARLRLYQNMLYHGDPSYPEVGDVRVWFEMAGRTEPGRQDKVKGSIAMDCISVLNLSFLSLSLSPDQRCSETATWWYADHLSLSHSSWLQHTLCLHGGTDHGRTLLARLIPIHPFPFHQLGSVYEGAYSECGSDLGTTRPWTSPHVHWLCLGRKSNHPPL